jgi:hypothetical protein
MRQLMVSLAVLLSQLACSPSTTVEKLEYGTYRISCTDAALDRCLANAANNACDRGPYYVVRGISNVNNRGPSELPDTAHSSQAIIKCGPQSGLGEDGKAFMAGAAPSAAAPVPAASAKPAVCAPGSTQPCTGTAACKGGQSCREDGSGYSPCDCGIASVAPASATEAGPTMAPAATASSAPAPAPQ